MSAHIARRHRIAAVRTRPPNRADPSRPRLPSPSPTMAATRDSRVRVADLFTGIGGFHLGFEAAGGEVVFASEIDRHARVTYEANFRSISPSLFSGGRFAGDITAVPSSSLPAFDVLTAGFPCQPFSVAGKGRGFDDIRGTLFFEIARIIRDTRPLAFVLENVAGLLHKNQRPVFETIRGVLEGNLGYSFHWKILHASDYGLPQLRPRLFMVGFRDLGLKFAFPEPVPLHFTLSDLLGGYVDREVARTVLASHYGKPHGAPYWWSSYLVDGREHHLTIDEIRRLQGFPDWFDFSVTDAQAIRQLGNAVAVPVATAVAERVLYALTNY